MDLVRDTVIDDLHALEITWRIASHAAHATPGLDRPRPVGEAIALFDFETQLNGLKDATIELLAARLQKKGSVQARTKRYATNLLVQAMHRVAKEMLRDANAEGIKLKNDAGYQMLAGGSIELATHVMTDFSGSEKYNAKTLLTEVRDNLAGEAKITIGAYAAAMLGILLNVERPKRTSRRFRQHIIENYCVRGETRSFEPAIAA